MKKRIGEILIENGSITPVQLKQALEQQKKEPGKLLGKILFELGFVTEEDIVVALATQFNVPYLPIGNFNLSDTASELIPKELIQKYMCIPLERVDNLLTVVMVDPTNEEAIREIEAVTKCKVQTFVATTSEIATVIQQRFKISISTLPKLGEGLAQVSFRSAATQKPEPKTAHKT